VLITLGDKLLPPPQVVEQGPVALISHRYLTGVAVEEVEVVVLEVVGLVARCKEPQEVSFPPQTPQESTTAWEFSCRSQPTFWNGGKDIY